MTEFLDIFVVAFVGALIVFAAAYLAARLANRRSIVAGRLARLGQGEDSISSRLLTGAGVAMLGVCVVVYLSTFRHIEILQSKQFVRESSTLATAADLAEQINQALARIESKKNIDSDDAMRREKLVEQLRVQAEAARARAEAATTVSSSTPRPD